MNITENLQRIQQAKNNIKDAIIQKGVQVDDSLTIDNFADKILQIEGGGGGEDNLDKLIKGTITSYNIPNGVYSIGSYAFYSATTLQSITIPNSVTSIGESAFSYCRRLTSVTIPNSVKSISNQTFYHCSNLNDIYCYAMFVPTIASDTFRDVKTNGVLHVHQDRISEYSTWMSNDDYYLGKYNWTIVDDLEYIPENRLICKYNVTSTSSGTRIKYNNYGLSGNTAWINDETTPIRLNSSDYTFTQLGENTIYFDSVNSIDNTLFSGCTNLTSVSIPDSVTRIDTNTFRSCTSLTSITIGNSVTSIGQGAIRSCTSLTSITIPDSVTSIDTNTFNGCTSLISVTIGNGMISIGQSAFNNCLTLTSINIPNSVTNMGTNVFYNCSSLTSITIPDSVTSIGDRTFYGCYFTIDNFINNSSLDAASNNYWGATIVDSDINGLCISGNSLLKVRKDVIYAVIPDGVTSIGASAFSDCTNLTTVTIPNGVTSIGSRVFYNCSNLTSVNYNGTISQWNAISKGSSWKTNVPSTCVVHCTDGDITISNA